MQQCTKCGRTYESDTQKFCTHDGGRLVAQNQAPTTYDLNQTVRTDPFDPEETVTRMPDLNKTVVSAPTSEIRSKETGPATPPPSVPTYQQPPSPPQPPPAQTVAFNQAPPPPQQPPQQYYQPPPAQPQQHQSPQQPQMQQQQYAPAPHPQQQQHGAPAPPLAARKSSRAPLIIGLVVVLLLGGAAAWYFLIYKKQNASANANTTANANTSANTNAGVNTSGNSNTTVNTNTNTTEPPPPPPNTTRFVNSKANLNGKLAENYSDFSFYYPNNWELDPKSGVAGASNFVKVERRLPPDFTQENFAVGWYTSKGTFEADEAGDVFKTLAEPLKARFAKSFPEFELLSEGETTINGMKGYEFRYKSVSKGTEKGDITIWGRTVFLPPGREGATNGVLLLMLTTSLAPEITGAQDVGVRGELPIILNSFRMGSR